jgi:hypothetical protein
MEGLMIDRRSLLRLCTLALLPSPTRVHAAHAAAPATGARTPVPASGSRLYVAAPGIRDYLEFGGAGLLVFDISDGHRFVRRIKTPDLPGGKPPERVKGVAAHAGTKRLYMSTPTRLMAFDLMTDRLLWETSPEGGCDRMALAPDGRFMYVPSFEGPHWNVVDTSTGTTIAKVQTNSGAHNTIYGRNGRFAYLAGLRSPLLAVADTTTHSVVKQIGPFANSIRPFTVNGRETLCFVNVNELLGFEVGDLETGKMLHRVEVKGFEKGPVKRHGCPSHGIGLTPDERELWVVDGANTRVHVFDATVMPPKQMTSIALREQPGWVTFSLDGRHAYPSTGEVIEIASKKIVAALTDETGRGVHSEKMVEVVFKGDTPAQTGDQFGLGRKR